MASGALIDCEVNWVTRRAPCDSLDGGLVMGKAVELTDQHRQYQANTVKTRTVSSTSSFEAKTFGE